MKTPGFIFGGNTDWTYDQLQSKRKIADLLAARTTSNAPRNVGEGINAIGQALLVRSMNKKADKRDGELRSEYEKKRDAAFGGGFSPGFDGGSFAPPAPRGPNQDIADDTMTAIGKPTSWDNIKAGIFAGESGGDYDALFGYQNRPGKAFQGVRVTDMTVDDALKFADPSGPYAQNVKGQVGHVATPMGAYQVVGTTLRAAKEGLGLTGQERMTPALQDKIGQWIYQTQGTGAWEGYKGPQSGGQDRAAGKVAGGGVGMSIQALAEVIGSPYASASEKAIAQTLLQQQMQANDPMSRLDLEYKQAQLAQAQLDLEQDRNGNVDKPASFAALDAQAQAAGLQPGTPEYQSFMLNGGGDPATFRALDMQAQAAGFTKGTPEYAEFMATRGAGIAAGAKTTAENEADIASGGQAAEAVAAGTERGKASVASNAELAEMERNLPGLLEVASQLEVLADKATYTKGGQLYDFARKQAGAEPREAAIARAEYIATVDNQVLPLLRQTFGAAFTAKEGDTLRATLGDPDKSPAEKKAVLNAFIAQKKRDVLARGGKVPAPPSGDDFESFAADPSVKASAEKYGVTIEEMWAIKQGLN